LSPRQKNGLFLSHPLDLSMPRTAEYRQLRAFVAVFDERNITVAARRINLTQPALSSSIKLLEETLGTTLFVRQARGVEVTDDARALYPIARRMIADAESLSTRFRERRDRTQLSIGIERDISRALIRKLINDVTTTSPHVQLRLIDGCHGDVRLASEEMQCEDEIFLPLEVETYLIATRGDNQQAIDLMPASCATSSVSWITYPTHPIHQRLLPLYGRAANAPAAQANSFELALDLVSAGQGVVIAPEPLIKERDDLVGVSLPGLDFKRRTGLCYSVQALRAPALADLREALMRR